MYRGTYSGKYAPDNPEKYVGDANNIVYRSSWERRFCQYADRNEKVLRWASEEVVVPYLSPIDKKIHRYFIDFWVEVQAKDEVKKFLIEIKPSQFCKPPQKRRSKQYLQEAAGYAVNKAKWVTASKFAKKNGMEFLVLTERDLGI